MKRPTSTREDRTGSTRLKPVFRRAITAAWCLSALAGVSGESITTRPLEGARIAPGFPEGRSATLYWSAPPTSPHAAAGALSPRDSHGEDEVALGGPPRFRRVPELPSAAPGDVLVVSAEVDGERPMRFSWTFNGEPLAETETAELTLGPLERSDAGLYQLVASNRLGEETSPVFTIHLNPLPREGVAIQWDAGLELEGKVSSQAGKVFSDGNGGAWVAGTVVSEEDAGDFVAVRYDGSGGQTWATPVDVGEASEDKLKDAYRTPDGGLVLVGESRHALQILPETPAIILASPSAAKVGPDGAVDWVVGNRPQLDELNFLIDSALDARGVTHFLLERFKSEVTQRGIFKIRPEEGDTTFTPLANDARQVTPLTFAVTPSGGVILVGIRPDPEVENAAEFRLMAINARGETVWQRGLPELTVVQNLPWKLFVDPSGGFRLVAREYDSGQGGLVRILGFDAEGGLAWDRALGAGEGSQVTPKTGAMDASGGLVVAADLSIQGAPTQIMAGRIGPDGSVQWSIIVPHSLQGRADRVTAMDLVGGGDVFLTAVRHSPETGQDFATIRLGADGNFRWEARFKQPGLVTEEATHLDADDDGGLVMTGYNLVDDRINMVTIRQTPVQGRPNELPKSRWITESFENGVTAPGKWTVELETEDPDGRVLGVVFYDGATRLGEDLEAPFTWTLQAEEPRVFRLVAQVLDDAGGVAVSDPLRIDVLEESQGPPRVARGPGSDLTVALDAPAVLDFLITGVQPIRYQWFLNGQRLREPDQPLLSLLPLVDRARAGSYVLRAQNSEGKLFTPAVVVSLDWPVLEGGDQFAEAVEITGDSGRIRAGNINATLEPGEPGHSGKRGGRSIWYRWRPAASGLASLSLQGSSFDTLLGVYAGPDMTQLTEIESDDDRAGFSTSQLRFSATAGVDYMIAIDGFNGSAGNILFSWDLDRTQAVALPRVRITPTKNSVNLNAGYVMQTSVAGGLQNVGLQWFLNGAPIPGATNPTWTIDAARPSDAGIYWIEIQAGNVTQLTRPGYLTVNLPRVGRIVRDLVTEEKFADLFFDLLLGGAPLRERNLGAGVLPRASSLATGFTGAQIFNTFGATKEPGEPDHCGVPGGASQWFAYQAPTNGALTISTEGSNFDTVLAAYTSTGGSFADLVEVACDNDSGSDGQDSVVTFPTTAGTIYFVAVDGVDAATGEVLLSYTLDVGITLEEVRAADTGLSLEIHTSPDVSVTIEGTEDFENWSPLQTLSDPDGIIFYTDPAMNDLVRRYYRFYATE